MLGCLDNDRLFHLQEIVKLTLSCIGRGIITTVCACIIIIQKNILIFLFKHGLHDSIQMEIDKLLVSRQKLKSGTCIDQLKPSYLANIIVLKNVVFIFVFVVFSIQMIILLSLRQISPLCIKTEHTSRLNLLIDCILFTFQLLL